jgi:hypothetical protein
MVNFAFKVIPADNFIWNKKELLDFLIVNQNQPIELSTNQEGCCCNAIGLYQLLEQFNYQQVTIYTANPIEHHDKFKIVVHLPWKFLSIKNKIDPELHQWTGTKIFGTVFGRPLWHRIGIVSHLKTNYCNQSSLGFFSDPHNVDMRELFETQQLFQNNVHSFVNFANLLECFPIRYTDVDAYTPGQLMTDGYVDQTKNIYKDFFVDIVAEPFTTGNCFFITEKTVRPMLLKKPFIIMASKNHLEYLRQMGFRTFGDFWDEDYDGYEGAERYTRIIQLIDKLAENSSDKLESIYWDMQYTLDHNYNLLMTQTYKKTIQPL